MVLAFPEEPRCHGCLANGADAVVNDLVESVSLGTGFGPLAGMWAPYLVPPFVGKNRDVCYVLEGPFHIRSD